MNRAKIPPPLWRQLLEAKLVHDEAQKNLAAATQTFNDAAKNALTAYQVILSHQADLHSLLPAGHQGAEVDWEAGELVYEESSPCQQST